VSRTGASSRRGLATLLPWVPLHWGLLLGALPASPALAYWQQRNGNSPVETKVTDFGCHVQVDIVANNKIAKSLRYQNGAITEM